MKVDLAIVIGANLFAATFILYDRLKARYTHHTNHLEHTAALHNQYIAVRHGQSYANELGVISSDRDIARVCHGLSAVGRQQVLQTAATLPALCKHSSVLIYSSDYLRAAETARILGQQLRVSGKNLVYTPQLRERDFGEFNNTSDINYSTVWQADAANAAHTEHGVESVQHVIQRVSKLIQTLEQQYTNTTILLVAHGDVLQIMQTVFERIDGTQHRTLKHLSQAEARELALKPLDAVT